MAKGSFLTSELAAKLKVCQPLAFQKSTLERAIHDHQGSIVL